MGMTKSYTNEYKAKVVLTVLREDRTMFELASEYGVHREFPVDIISGWGPKQVSDVYGITTGHDVPRSIMTLAIAFELSSCGNTAPPDIVGGRYPSGTR